MDNETDLSFKLDEIRKLKRLLGTLRAFASKNRSLVKKLGLENKLVETIGEGMGLLLCYEKFGSSVSYEWPGRRKKGYDLRLKREERSVKIQVKTNTDERYDFKFSAFKVNNEARKQLEEGNTELLFHQLKSEYEGKPADLFLLIHWPKLSGSSTCYILDKRSLIRALCEDYKVQLDKKNHRGDYHFGISKKTWKWWPHINQKTVDSIRQFKENWNLIVKALGPL